MNNLEDFIKNNKSQFDIDNPSKSHFKKMQKKLGYSEIANKTILLTNFFKYASIFIVLLISSYLIYINNINKTCLPQNIIETQNYFVNQVSEVTSQLNSKNISSDEQKIILNELSEIDSMYNINFNDFCQNPENDYVIKSMINHYKTKIKVINKILNKLSQKDIENKNDTTDVFNNKFFDI